MSSNSVFRQNRCLPSVNFQRVWCVCVCVCVRACVRACGGGGGGGGRGYAVTLKIRLRSPKSNHFFAMSQLYSYGNLVRIQPLVPKILCRQETFMQMPTPMPTGSAPKTICSPPRRWGDITRKLFFFFSPILGCCLCHSKLSVLGGLCYDCGLFWVSPFYFICRFFRMSSRAYTLLELFLGLTYLFEFILQRI